MRVLVFGAGAIGSVLGGLLAQAGHDVTLLGRPWHLDAIARQGLRVEGLWGAHHLRPEPSALTLATAPEHITRLLPTAPFDWIFVCVKASQTAQAAETLTPWLRPGTLVCAFQNGLGNYEALTARVPAPRVALARVIFGAEVAEPGRVRVTVCADEVLLGAPDPAVPRERIIALASALQEAGVPARATTTILTAIWGKVLYNCALNGLSTLLEVPYGRLLEREAAKRLMRRIIEEAYRIAQAQGLRLEPSNAAAYAELLFTRLIPDTAAHHPSMLQDLRRGRATEIESLNGALVRLAQALDLDAPANELVTRLVQMKERLVLP